MPLPSDLEVSTERSADCLMGVPLYVSSCFSLAAFNSLSLTLLFAILIKFMPNFAPYVHVPVTFCGPFFFFFQHLYWSIIALQWGVSSCCITK